MDRSDESLKQGVRMMTAVERISVGTDYSWDGSETQKQVQGTMGDSSP